MQNDRHQAAERALDAYDFGWEISDRAGWDDTLSDDWTSICYAEPEEPEQQRVRLNFHVRFQPGTAEVLESYALHLGTGDLVGGPASSPLERAEALGFPSVEAMEDHQRWAEQLKQHEDDVQHAIKQAGDSPIIDIRNVLWPK